LMGSHVFVTHWRGVRDCAACVHACAGWATCARELVATPPRVATRATSAPAARHRDIRAGRLCSSAPRLRTPHKSRHDVRRGRFSFTSRESLPSRAQLCSRRDIDMTSIVASTASIRVAAPASTQMRVARGCARVNARHAAKRPSVRMKMAIEADAETVSVESEKVTAFYADQMVDEAGMLAQSTFPIAPEDLIAKCKLILAKNNGGEDPSLLAADFKFVAPVVGPLKKDPFLAAFQSFKLDEGFPDAKFNYYHFRVDPFEPSRVWYDARFFGTNTGDLIGGESSSLFPSYRQLE
jgi:hypothetical protein